MITKMKLLMYIPFICEYKRIIKHSKNIEIVTKN